MRLIDLPLTLLDEREHLTRDVAFEAADRLQLGVALADALGHVCPVSYTHLTLPTNREV